MPEISPDGERSPVKGKLWRSAAALAAMASSITGIGAASTEHAPESSASAAASPEPVHSTLVPPATETRTFTLGDSEQYAPEFAPDPAAGRLSQPEVPRSNAESIAAALQGDHIESITVQGSASAEDASPGPTEGVTTPSQQNLDLAAKRAEVFTPQLQAALAAAGISAPEIAMAMPLEDSWSPAEVAGAAAMAEQFGYGNFAHMIDAYNRAPQEVPPDVGQFLDKALQAHRNVRVAVVIDRQQARAVALPRPAEPKELPPVPVKKRSLDGITTHPVGYVPEPAVAGPLPQRQRGYDSHASRFAPQRGGDAPARLRQQPLPDNYTPQRGLDSQGKTKSQSRNRRGR